MSSPTPIHISELPVATSLNSSDSVPLSQGGIDRQVTLSLLQAINWASITLGTVLNDSDQVLINQSGTKKVPASLFKFPSGTQMWFLQATAPLGWTIVDYPGDVLLAVKGVNNYTVAPSAQGTWQQDSVALSIDQIPAHDHFMDTAFLYPGSGAANTDRVGAAAPGNSGPGAHINYVKTFPTGGAGSNLDTSNGNNAAPNRDFPAANAHNHGSAWRPAAYVGIICSKD